MACLKRRDDEKNEEMPKSQIAAGLNHILESYPQMMTHPTQQPVSNFVILL